MQGYIYSVFSLAAIAIHLIINFNLIAGRSTGLARVARYRGFLSGILAYYVADALWGILAGLDWTRALYADTVLYFLALVAFVCMWSRFTVAYLDLGRWTSRTLAVLGYALFVFNILLMVANAFNNCFFYFDEQGRYLIGDKRYLAFSFLIAYAFLVATVVLAKALRSQGTVRKRSMMVFLFCITMSVAILLQVFWPLTPFTALGCLIGNCFFHVFVITDEQTAKHMAALEKALTRAHAAEKSRSMFFSIVSHDIRTPLNAILGYSELLRYGIKRKSERDEALDAIRASGTTLLQLVNDVLDLAKIDAGKMTLQPASMRLDELTEDVFASFRLVAAGKGIDLVNRTADVPALCLDEHRLRQILFNLVGNAVKFTDRGSVSVSARYTGTELTLSVADTGCGIAPDMLKHVLDPFVQIHDLSHASDRATGSGLGLAICRRIAKAMGGRLTVESRVGEGSTFTVHLTHVATGKEPPSRVRGEDGPAADTATLPKHVLVVDDSPVNRAVLTAFLKKAGIDNIDHASDGAEALNEIDAALKAGRAHDFVFTDFWMPNMNGLEFITRLRAEPRFSHLPVFAVTADTEFRNDARHRLFDGVLLKPLTYSRLMEAFASAAKNMLYYGA